MMHLTQLKSYKEMIIKYHKRISAQC